ncbi:ABC transporter substrate-binding protein [Nitratireductor aquimarinus]|uniref:ABC transporter substrate-binding protein n=1 Tax=Nitratireductor aquimarinus TaxID=889300 RepID=UPI001A8FC165|nr:ABC transporter substrate-binding protein [Nitratireductor aquimarinus]MBN8245764.1 ABC transporter substrate-binding protein [Nitratireductor aquimarinus]MBY6134144.1 ABC transporter substrate-binding protein [Nitratireductor aquimarinus]MCA1305242.1 ABC transporter substrate-binding protein [Nitratireductor aquimarinus]
MKKNLFLGVAISALAIAPFSASAEALVVGVKAEISAADPHVLFGPNRDIGGQVYEPLFGTDNAQNPVPGIVTEWTAIEPTVYEFHLRDDVEFSDGKPLTSEDVKFSIERAQNLDAPRTFKTYLSDIEEIEIVDDTTFRIHTTAPTAILVNNLATVGLVSSTSAVDATEEDFVSGNAAVGTGPYLWSEWIAGDHVTLTANPNYWGDAPEFDQITYRFISNDSTRAAALLSGDVDVIDAVSPTIVSRIEETEGFEVYSGTSYMLFYVGLNQHADENQYVTDKDGNVIPNPFKDQRVREAVSKLVNRDLIADRVMEGFATPAGQFVPEGMSGHIASLTALEYDPAGAKALLSQAGYPEGFNLTIQCTADRYMNDGKVCQALGQLLSAGGIATEVQTIPSSAYFGRASTGGPNGEPEFAFFTVGFGAANGVADAALSALAMTYDKEAGTGANNRARYSNPQVDALSNEARSENDPEKRQALLSEAQTIAIGEQAIVPIHFLNSIWAAREGIVVTPRTDGFTRDSNVDLAK